MPRKQDAPPTDLRSLLDLAVSVSLEAGRAVLDVYASDFAVQCKDDRSPLTLADERSHEIIANRLSGAADRFPLLSEEGRSIPYAERREWQTFWLVDPLDGTKEFVKRNGEFTVNIALVQRGRPVLGVIYVPVQDVLYYAADGLGAWQVDHAKEEAPAGGNAVRLPRTGAHRPFTVVASRSHRSPETETFLQELRTRHGAMETVSAGSSLKFCLLAAGSADVYPRFAPTMEWDTGAGQAIVQEAGGTVVRHSDGKDLVYNKEDLLNPWFVARGPDSTKGAP